MRMPGYPAGVPNPLTRHYHPYPTRFHGSQYVRPVFTLPYVLSPLHVNMPGEIAGLGSDFNVGRGIFRPGGYGGGVFDGNLAGLGAIDVAALTQDCVKSKCAGLYDPTALAACMQACAASVAAQAKAAAAPAVPSYVPTPAVSPEASAQTSMVGSGDSKWLMFAVGGAVAVGALIYLKKKGKLG